MKDERCPKCHHKMFEHDGGQYELTLTTEHSKIAHFATKEKCPKCKAFVKIYRIK